MLPIQGGHLPGEPGKVGEFKSGHGKRESRGKCVLAYGQLPRVLILTQNVQKRNYLLGTVVAYMLSVDHLRVNFLSYELPAIFSTYFEEKNFIHHHDTRHKDHFYTHSVNTEFGKRSVKYKGCKLRKGFSYMQVVT